ncbi:MAG: hypothetical protein IJN25_03200 [Clostridia bacterium]|nr:hypothetical protein [Clostridia bacterium]
MQSDNRAAVFILLGQSNAVGHALPMREENKIIQPMKNVFGLSRAYNQSFDNTELRWSGYTSYGMNLGEEQDNTYSVANCLAQLWQDEIDRGNEKRLPDLYIVHIAIGAQGVTEGYMWNPEYEKKIIPGVLRTVDIALTPLTNHILSLLKESFDTMEKDFEVIGLHWRGSENDASASWEVLENTAQKIHAELFRGFCENIGREVPVILHRLVSHERCTDLDPTGESLKKMHYINSVFDTLEKENNNITVWDVRNCPHYVPDVRGNGIFIEDVVHFTEQTNRWVAEQILKRYIIS